jgi:hypothetical protein
MKRREFITLLGGAAAWPLGARAQQARGIRRVVVLMGAAETGWSRGWLASFLRRLDELGWREGRNLVTQVQWWNDQPEQMRAWAAELMARTPDVAMAFSNPALAILKPLAGDIPIVFVGVGDPVGSASLQVLLALAETSPASPVTRHRWAASGLRCSRKRRPMSPESWRSCTSKLRYIKPFGSRSRMLRRDWQSRPQREACTMPPTSRASSRLLRRSRMPA